jgi:serine/threonine-protein kinase
MSEFIRMPAEGDWVDGRFLLQHCLGRGGYGIVYKARQRGLRRYVAIKMLLPHALGKPTLLARFKREANLASSLHHPNTVMIHTFGVHQWEDGAAGVPFLAMEYLLGETLQSYLNRVGFLPPDAAMDVLLQVAGSLAEAHQQGIIHRDVKPGNIFLCTRNGRPGMVKVLDFGIAKVFAPHLEPDQESEHLTGTGVTPGTVDYMAPDLALGETTQTPAIDIYALGCMAFRMVMGQVPYQGKTPLEISIKHVSNPIPPLTPSLERHPIATIIRRAMAKRPHERYPDAQAFARELVSLRGDQPPWSPSWAGLPPIQDESPGGDSEAVEDESLREELRQGPASLSSRPSMPSRSSRPSLKLPTAPDRQPHRISAQHAPGPAPTLAELEDPGIVGVDSPLKDVHAQRDSQRRLVDLLALVGVGLLLAAALGVVAIITAQEQNPQEQLRLLRVDSEPPGASIFLNQQRLGLTPYSFPHPYGDGDLTLTLFKKGYRAESIRFSAGSLNEVTVSMVPDPNGVEAPITP